MQALATLTPVVAAWADELARIRNASVNDVSNTAQLLVQLRWGLFTYENTAGFQSAPLTGPNDKLSVLNSYLTEYTQQAKDWNDAPQVIKSKTSTKWRGLRMSASRASEYPIGRPTSATDDSSRRVDNGRSGSRRLAAITLAAISCAVPNGTS